MEEANSEVRAFYQSRYDEQHRHGRETLEFTRTRHIISRYLLSAPMDIADICGAAGAYSFWLAGMGHRVHLLDLAQNHIEIAMQRGRDSDHPLASYTCADARCLPYEDNSMDLALLMGALYHLREPQSRSACLAEAARVLRPGGRLLCTVISRYTLVTSGLKYGLYGADDLDALAQSLSTGITENTKLPLFYGHTPDEITAEMATAGFQDIRLTAVEGIANAVGDNIIPDDEQAARVLLGCIQLTESVPELMGVSRNILAAGIK